MGSHWLLQLVQGTADAAFAVDANGSIAAWNDTAGELFGLRQDEVIDRPCHEILRGVCESGPFCSEHCSIHQALELNQPVSNFDLRLQTSRGTEWCNVTITIVGQPDSETRHALHIVQRLDVHRLIELLARIMSDSRGTAESQTTAQLVSSSLSSVPQVKLTRREKEILGMLASGKRTSDIAILLFISPATVNNHVQHVMDKLDSHSRLEVVARAREAGII